MLKLASAYAPMSVNTVFCDRQSARLGADGSWAENSLDVSQRRTSRSGAANGSGRSSTPLTALKMALVAPMPTASVSTIASIAVGARRA